jgi:hypothetical protein
MADQPEITCEICGGPLPASFFQVKFKPRPLCGSKCIALWGELNNKERLTIEEYQRRFPGRPILEDKL